MFASSLAPPWLLFPKNVGYNPPLFGNPTAQLQRKIISDFISEQGFVLYYTAGCPYTAKYAPVIDECAKQNGITFKSIKIDSREKAQSAPAAWTNYALFYNGEYVTNEILSEKKFISLAESLK